MKAIVYTQYGPPNVVHTPIGLLTHPGGPGPCPAGTRMVIVLNRFVISELSCCRAI